MICAMETSRFIGRALIAGMRRGADARITQAVLSILGLVGFTLIGSPLWSQQYVWQGCALVSLVLAATIGSGAHVIHENEIGETTTHLLNLTRESAEQFARIEELESELNHVRYPNQLPQGVNNPSEIAPPHGKVGVWLENTHGATVQRSVFRGSYNRGIMDINGEGNSHTDNDFG